MDYKYNAVNELNHFDFAEAVVGDVQLLGKMFHMVIDNVKILPENSFNRDIRTMRTNGMLFKIEGAEILLPVDSKVFPPVLLKFKLFVLLTTPEFM